MTDTTKAACPNCQRVTTDAIDPSGERFECGNPYCRCEVFTAGVSAK